MTRAPFGFRPLAAALAVAAVAGTAAADPIRPGFDQFTFPALDDGSSPAVPLGFTVNFLGTEFSSVYVNANGNVTFDEPLPNHIPDLLPETGRQIIAPFFGDVDTRPPGSALITYGYGTVDGRPAFGANWPGVGYFDQHADRLNDFQLVLIDRSDTGAGNFDVEFNYRRIQWESGDASGGEGGESGASARAGYTNGTYEPGMHYEIPGSGDPGSFPDDGTTPLSEGGNTPGVPGRFRFGGRDGGIDPNPPPVGPTAVPAPAAVGLFGVGLGLVVLARRGRRTPG
jgi:hypothetical protein